MDRSAKWLADWEEQSLAKKSMAGENEDEDKDVIEWPTTDEEEDEDDDSDVEWESNDDTDKEEDGEDGEDGADEGEHQTRKGPRRRMRREEAEVLLNESDYDSMNEGETGDWDLEF
jgi:hypothetical protein